MTSSRQIRVRITSPEGVTERLWPYPETHGYFDWESAAGYALSQAVTDHCSTECDDLACLALAIMHREPRPTEGPAAALMKAAYAYIDAMTAKIERAGQ